jgi:hypothetical protein
MTRTPASDWTPWYVDIGDGRVRCRICRDDFIKKNGRMLSHLWYIRSSEERNNNVKLCKNMNPDVLRAFHGCGSLALVPPEPAELQHLQGSAESEEPICHASQSSTMHASCGASRTLQPLVGPFGILQVLLRSYSHLRGRLVHGSLQQSTIPVLHAEEQRCKCDMAWAKFFYSANIPFAAARSTSFKKAVKMTSEMQTSYLPLHTTTYARGFSMRQSIR